jgi:DNA-binding CsgD family transcriptional regulator/tetratricopeptide (TPR) repeat protein
MLLGRRGECDVLDQLLAAVREGRSAALVLRGELGIGKTALLDYAVDCASGFRITQAAAVQSEMELPFAALHQICAPMLDRLERLPEPQRHALGTAFGLVSGNAADRFFVGLAALTLVSEAASGEPLLCVVDDAQWLDEASADALAFVARRLGAESVGMLFALREANERFSGLPELVIGGLRDIDARELLASAVPGPLDERVRERIVAEARGNPLALLELPRGLSTEELAGGFGLPHALPLIGPIEESFVRRLEELPEESRLLLLVAAAEPVGDPALVWRASERLGVGRAALDPAERAGLLEIGARVRFRHPLVRSAVYQVASLSERQGVHTALAEVTDPRVDPDRRAWHRAQASAGPDEEVATELEQSAGRAERRGGFAAAGAFLERAVGLTLDPALRPKRALAAARAKQLAGAPDAAVRMLQIAEAGPLDDLQRARIELLRAQLAFASGRGDATVLLLRAAKRLERLDLKLARETYLDALLATQFASRLAHDGGVREVAQAALAAPQPSHQGASDLLLNGLATRFAGEYAESAPMLRQALNAYPKRNLSSEDELRWMWLAGHAAVDLWMDEEWTALANRHVQLARETGALNVLPIALSMRIAAYAFAGELAAAASLLDEVQVTVEATGSPLAPYGALLLAAWRGKELEVSELSETIVKEAVPRGEGLGITITEWARALLYNALGRYEEALPAAQRACEHPEDLGFANWGLVELILAAVRSGEQELAVDAFERLSEMTRASSTDWGLGIEARSCALLSDGDLAEGLYREAIERLGHTRIRVERARSHLQYGEWLRREGRRRDAREQLRTAEEMFVAMGIQAFAPRVDRERLASGERARKRTAQTREELTPQEAQVARLARDGLSNSEIGSRLVISPRTVEYHLSKVFIKLGISSRNQLNRALPETDASLAAG